jgi:hypothetical protein
MVQAVHGACSILSAMSAWTIVAYVAAALVVVLFAALVVYSSLGGLGWHREPKRDPRNRI